jgi:UDP-N-acetylmuramoyl-tripeptide--D-alanyl-D-alanine ligase
VVKAHLEGFGSFEGVIKTKKELYDRLADDGKTAFVFSDQKELLEMSEHIDKRLFYSFEDKNSWCYGKWYSKYDEIHLEWSCNGAGSEVVSPLFGKYNAINILAAVCLGNYFTLSPEQIAEGIHTYIPENNRSQKLSTAKGNNMILDAYNANPVSMTFAIESFLEKPVKNRCLILGDMFELGDYSRNEHAAIIDLLLSHKDKFEMAILAGKHFQTVQKDDPQLAFFENREEIPASSVLSSFVNKNILIKGSRGMKLESLLNYL